MQTIGYIEVAGLSNAIIVADKMLKTASVELTSLENSKGGGWIMVVVKGDVSAVSVAIEMGKEAVGDAYVGSTVLANPAPGIEGLSQGSVFTKPTSNPKPTPDVTVTPLPVEQPIDEVHEAGPAVEHIQPAKDYDQKKLTSGSTTALSETTRKATCNLCGDPECPRKLGEPRKKCIHYRELKKDNH